MKALLKTCATIMLLLAAAMISIPTMAHAEMQPAKKLRAGIPPFQIIKDIMHHNASAPQQPVTMGPLVTWLADPDERISPNFILPDPRGKLYSVRNTANQFILAAGAIDYGVHTLLTPLLLITGNTDNRAIALFQKDYRNEPMSLRQELDHLHPTKNTADEASPLTTLVEANVDYQVWQCVTRYGERINAGRLAVIGAVIDLDNSYGLGVNRLIIININGDTDPASMMRRPEAMTLGIEFRPTIMRYQAPQEERENLPEQPTLPRPNKP